jgi:biofilm protein TabA
MITDTLNNADQYPLGAAWSQAIEFIKTLDSNTPDGKYPLNGETMFAMVMSYETKPPAKARFEAHKKYADVQATLDGAEGIAVVDINNLEVSVPYNEVKDLTFFEAPEIVPALVDVYPGSFAFLLPQDVHMPQLQVGEARKIKKVVVKIALSELGL